MKSTRIPNERSFSIELNSMLELKTVSLNDGTHENVLLEGTIGELEHARFTEEAILEIVGKRGIIRVDLSQDQLKSSAQIIKNQEGIH